MRLASLRSKGLAFRILIPTLCMSVVISCNGIFAVSYADTSSTTSTTTQTQTFTNGTLAKQTTLTDTSGKRIDAHDGHIYLFGGTYYWYGTSYQCGFDYAVKTSHYCGVKVYESTNLTTWRYDGLALDPTTNQSTWDASCGGGAGGCYRPKVAYNAAHHNYVMWINESRGTEGGGYLVLTASSPTGTFKKVSHQLMSYNRCPAGQYGSHAIYGDEDLFVDTNGTAYLIYGAINKTGNNCPATTLRAHNIAIEKLNSAYTAGTGTYRVYNDPYHSVESPSFFRRGNTYYLLYSDPACPYCNNAGTGYATASSPTGTYTYQGVLTPSQLGGQPTGVTAISTGTGTQYLYYLDRWNQVGTSTAISNQYKANYFFAPLSFTAAGKILPIPAVTSWQTQVTDTKPSLVTAIAPTTSAGTYQPLVPTQRFVDSRKSGGLLQPSHGAYTYKLPASLRNVTSVVLNVTATGATGGGYFRVWGSGAKPATSTINYSSARATVANMTVVQPAADGTILVTANTAPANLIIDILGSYGTKTSYKPISPARRLVDTRQKKSIAAHGYLNVSLFSGGLVPTSAHAISANITTIASVAGSLSVYDPTKNATPPSASASPFNVGVDANFSELPVPANGVVRLYNNSTKAINVLLDVTGYDSGTAMNVFASPYLLASSQTGNGPYTLPLQSGISYAYDATQAGVPASASAVIVKLNTSIVSSGYLTTYANQSGYAGTSNLNFVAKYTQSNTTIIPLWNGAFDVYGKTASPYDLSLSVIGYVK